MSLAFAFSPLASGGCGRDRGASQVVFLGRLRARGLMGRGVCAKRRPTCRAVRGLGRGGGGAAEEEEGLLRGSPACARRGVCDGGRRLWLLRGKAALLRSRRSATRLTGAFRSSSSAISGATLAIWSGAVCGLARAHLLRPEMVAGLEAGRRAVQGSGPGPLRPKLLVERRVLVREFVDGGLVVPGVLPARLPGARAERRSRAPAGGVWIGGKPPKPCTGLTH